MEIVVKGDIISMNIFDKTTVVICAAGMGTRLGIGTTKALVDIDGKPLIIRQLELLKDFDDVRIVVGFQAERLIRVVKDYRKDVVFVFNYDYENTGVADSLRKGMLASREYILSIDGDILINPEDFTTFINLPCEALGITPVLSAEPVKATVKDGSVFCLSKTEGNMQWPGIAKITKVKINDNSSHVYDVLNYHLPMNAYNIRARVIDTQEDYEDAIAWFEGGCVD